MKVKKVNYLLIGMLISSIIFILIQIVIVHPMKNNITLASTIPHVLTDIAEYTLVINDYQTNRVSGEYAAILLKRKTNSIRGIKKALVNQDNTSQMIDLIGAIEEVISNMEVGTDLIENNQTDQLISFSKKYKNSLTNLENKIKLNLDTKPF